MGDCYEWAVKYRLAGEEAWRLRKLLLDEEGARRFAKSHPESHVVRRTVTVSEWEKVGSRKEETFAVLRAAAEFMCEKDPQPNCDGVELCFGCRAKALLKRYGRES